MRCTTTPFVCGCFDLFVSYIAWAVVDVDDGREGGKYCTEGERHGSRKKHVSFDVRSVDVFG